MESDGRRSDGLIRSERDFAEAVKRNEIAVAHFWASWCEPCRQLDAVLSILTREHSVNYITVEAEEATEVSIRFEVTVVPLVIFLKAGQEIDRLEGADIPVLKEKFGRLQKPSASPLRAEGARPDAAPHSLGAQPDSRKGITAVQEIVNSQAVILLMKGTPESPQCGFSSRAVSILHRNRVEYASFDILRNNDIREAAKIYSDWPSYPQLYIRGSFIGGCDILQEMDGTGEFLSLLGASGGPSRTSKCVGIEGTLESMINSAKIVLFMKGSPEAPRCGFSAKVVQALKSEDVNLPFTSYDILQEQEVREALKKYSQWPTYPQLYAGGEFLGGCDIILELMKKGQLRPHIEALLLEGAEP